MRKARFLRSRRTPCCLSNLMQPQQGILFTHLYVSLIMLVAAARQPRLRPNPHRHGEERHDRQALRRGRSHPHQSRPGHGRSRTHQDRRQRQFHFQARRRQGPHLVRVIHQEVTYHRMAPPGSTSVEVRRLRRRKKVEDIEVVADIMRFQAGQGQLQVERTFAVQNNSKPPRTQMNEHNLRVLRARRSDHQEGQAMTAGGQPREIRARSRRRERQESSTRFFSRCVRAKRDSASVYTVPYTGQHQHRSQERLSSGTFRRDRAQGDGVCSGARRTYKSLRYPGQPDANVEVASNAKLGQAMAFKLSGEGALAQPADDNGQSSGRLRRRARTVPAADSVRRSTLPTPLQKYRWYILGGFAAALVIGGVFVASRQQAANRAARTAGLSTMEESEDFEVPPSAGRRPARASAADAPAANSRGSVLLSALKDELFDLEVEHKQGRISQEEYEKTKAALDQTLERALKREAQKQS